MLHLTGLFAKFEGKILKIGKALKMLQSAIYLLSHNA